MIAFNSLCRNFANDKMQTPLLLSQSCDFCNSRAGKEEVFLLQEFSSFAIVLTKELETLSQVGFLLLVMGTQKGRNKIA